MVNPIEEPLSGGNSSDSVVRVGDTVRKPWLATTERTVAFMNALRERGIDLPEPRGRDDSGRLVLEFVPGVLAMEVGPLDVVLLQRIGRLVRSIHDASAGLPVPGGWPVLLPVDEQDLLCHNDLAAWNLVIDDDRLVFIDWDGAGPSNRLWDLAYAAVSFGHLFPPADPADAALRLGAFLDGYQPDAELRAALPETMPRRAEAMHQLLERSHQAGVQPWGQMYVDGHGEHWRTAADYIAEHGVVWRDAIQALPFRSSQAYGAKES